MDDWTWKCEICSKVRPDAKISVVTYDMSDKYNLPVGTMSRNVKYCNDNPACIEGANIMEEHKLMGWFDWKGGETDDSG